MNKKLEIKKYPDPILKKKSGEIKEITQELKELAFDMLKTMEENDGAGLAAPQVGELKRIIVVQTIKGPEIFFNPRIIKKSVKKEKAEEGCLSIPGLFYEIKRAKEIELEVLDIEGKLFKIKAKGLQARIFQHEIDHLQGKLIIDRLSFWQRRKIKKALKDYAVD